MNTCASLPLLSMASQKSRLAQGVLVQSPTAAWLLPVESSETSAFSRFCRASESSSSSYLFRLLRLLTWTCSNNRGIIEGRGLGSYERPYLLVLADDGVEGLVDDVLGDGLVVLGWLDLHDVRDLVGAFPHSSTTKPRVRRGLAPERVDFLTSRRPRRSSSFSPRDSTPPRPAPGRTCCPAAPAGPGCPGPVPSARR